MKVRIEVTWNLLKLALIAVSRFEIAIRSVSNLRLSGKTKWSEIIDQSENGYGRDK